MITSEFGRISLLWALCAMFDDFKFSFRYLSSLFFFDFFQQHTSLSIRQSIITHDFTLMRQITSNSACYLQGSGNWGCFYARGPDFGHSIFCSICYYTLFFIALFLLSLFLSYFCFKHYVSAVFFLLGETPLLFHCSFSLSPMIFGIRTEKIAIFLFFRCNYCSVLERSEMYVNYRRSHDQQWKTLERCGRKSKTQRAEKLLAAHGVLFVGWKVCARLYRKRNKAQKKTESERMELESRESEPRKKVQAAWSWSNWKLEAQNLKMLIKARLRCDIMFAPFISPHNHRLSQWVVVCVDDWL